MIAEMTHLKLIWSRLVSVQQYWINTGLLFSLRFLTILHFVRHSPTARRPKDGLVLTMGRSRIVG